MNVMHQKHQLQNSSLDGTHHENFITVCGCWFLQLHIPSDVSMYCQALKKHYRDLFQHDKLRAYSVESVDQLNEFPSQRERSIQPRRMLCLTIMSAIIQQQHTPSKYFEGTF